MIRIVLVFFFLAIVFGFVIQTVRKMNNLERLDLIKTICFAIMCSLGAIVLMMIFVALF